MTEFVIDTVGDYGGAQKDLYIPSNTNKDEIPTNKDQRPKSIADVLAFIDQLTPATVQTKTEKVPKKPPPKPWENIKKGNAASHSEQDDMERRMARVNEVLKKSVIGPDFETLHSVPPYEESKRAARAKRKIEREKTKGAKWFGMPATEMTEEVKRDLEVLQMRSVLDPKHFYKKNDLKVLPKYFQIGKVMDSPLDYYSSRLTKKERKRTLVDELMADAEFNKYNKRRYKEIIAEKQKTHYKAYRQAKKLKRKNKK